MKWESFTTGGVSGVILSLSDENSGILSFNTDLVSFEIPVSEITADPRVFEAGGLSRQVEVSALPKTNNSYRAEIETTVPLDAKGDNPIYVKVIQEDGHMAWSSPIYLVSD